MEHVQEGCLSTPYVNHAAFANEQAISAPGSEAAEYRHAMGIYNKYVSSG